MLQGLLGLELWFITRVRLDDWIVTHLRGAAPFGRGDVLPLSPNVRGRLSGPHREQPAAEGERDDHFAVPLPPGDVIDPAHFDVKSYVGAPLVVKDQLYGVLCGLDRVRGRRRGDDDAPYLMTAARLLSTILGRELDAQALLRRAERAEAEALVDDLTGLFNRRGWDRLVEREEARALRYGSGATVYMMDLDGLKTVNDEFGHAAGDTMLRTVADCIRRVVREQDVAARLGGDEFALLAVETDDEQSNMLLERLEASFAEAHVLVSIGAARRGRIGGIVAAVDRADALMYDRKAARYTS